jgi:hypothetical protein
MLLLFLPIYTTSSITVTEQPVRSRTERDGHLTLLSVNGPKALAVLAVPVIAALIPVLFPKRRVRAIAAMVLSGFCLLGGFSVGLFYVPSAVTMRVASLREP